MLAESHSLGETAGRRLSVASRGSYDKEDTWAWGRPYGPSWHPFGLSADTTMPTPPAAHQLDRADKHETVTREGIGITFL